jgi:stage IV sporulation protein FB
MEIRIHPAFPILILSAIIFGQWDAMKTLLAALVCHETGHAVTAKAVGLNVPAMELTPIGGVARIEGLSETEAWRDVTVSAAGPFTNLIIAMAAVFGAQMGWWKGAQAEGTMRSNIMLMLMNLLPLLPMDGGRMLRGVLSRWIPRAKVTRVLAVAGMAAGGLIVAAGILLIINGQANLTLIMTGSYLIYTAANERYEAVEQVVRTLSQRTEQIRLNGLLPTKWMTLSKDYPVSKIPAKLSPKFHHMFTVVDPAGLLPLGTITERDLLDALMKNPAGTVGELLNVAVKPPTRETARAMA